MNAMPLWQVFCCGTHYPVATTIDRYLLRAGPTAANLLQQLAAVG